MGIPSSVYRASFCAWAELSSADLYHHISSGPAAYSVTPFLNFS